MRLIALLAIVAFSCGAPITMTNRSPGFRSIPVSVYADAELTQMGYAMDAWNQAVGCRLFVETTDREHAEIVVAAEGEAGRKGANGGDVAGDYIFDGLQHQINIFNAGRGDVIFEYQVEMHELGHALGLAHDAWRNSIMAEVTTGRFNVFIHDDDAEAVGSRYCP